MLALVLIAQALSLPPPLAAQRDVVVVGTRLPEEDAWAACLARGCSVPESVAAALALAKTRFVAGDYERARATLRSAIRHHRGDAKVHPLPVASLWREEARVETHLGEYERYRASLLESVQVLRRGLGESDPARLAGLLDLGDMEMHLGHRQSAESFYRGAVTAGERSGRLRVAAIARYRLANMLAMRGPGIPTTADEREAAAMLAPIIGARDPELARFDFTARLFLARLAERRGEQGRVDALLRSLPPGARVPPLLLSSQPVLLTAGATENCMANPGWGMSGGTGGPPNQAYMLGCQNPRDLKGSVNVERQWIDVRFRIGEDGAVRDVTISRLSDHYTGDWAKDVVASVRSRRYAALPYDRLDQSAERVERFTLTAPFQVVTGERLRSRAPNPVIETEDLTPPPGTRSS